MARGIFEEMIWDMYGMLGWASWGSPRSYGGGTAGHASVVANEASA